jgi:hypothetical protein
VTPDVFFYGPSLGAFGAACAARKAFGSDTDYLPFEAPVALSEVAGKHVIIAGVSPVRAVVESMLQTCRSVLVIEHGQEVSSDWGFLSEADTTWTEYAEGSMRPDHYLHNGAVLFSRDTSVASMGWSFFHSGITEPALFRYLNWYELGVDKPSVVDTMTALASYELDFITWEFLSERFETSQGFWEFVLEGRAILRQRDIDRAP